MVRFVALFRTPEDPAEFDRHYFGGHLPLVHAIPGLSRVSVQRVSRMLGGEPAFHLMAQLEFADAAALRAALHSEEWRRLGADLTSWGGDRLAVMFTAEEATTG